jgi:perosamine synthetase
MEAARRSLKAPTEFADLPVIPVFRPDITEREIEAVAATMRSGWIGPGPRTAEFEKLFAESVGAQYAISVSTGTAALLAALFVLDVGPGDEIIIPSFTWVSVFQVISSLGATPVLADIEADYLTIDPEDVRRLIGPNTKGIIGVHHGGQLADLTALQSIAREHGLWLIEDAAHACGSQWQGQPVGAHSDATCFSFNAMKNLSIGDGGMVTTENPEHARRLRLYRSLGVDKETYARYGSQDGPHRWSYDVVSKGQRLHLNDISASIGLVQLQRLKETNRCRAALAKRYAEELANVPQFRFVKARPESQPSHHMFTVQMSNRDTFIEQMQLRRISVGVHYVPIHHFTIARNFRRPLPVTEEVWQRVTTFPLYPAMTVAEQDRVIAGAREIAGIL